MMEALMKLLLLLMGGLLLGWCGSILWNAVMPLFGTPKVTVIQFICLALLLRILFPAWTNEKKD